MEVYEVVTEVFEGNTISLPENVIVIDARGEYYPASEHLPEEQHWHITYLKPI